MRIIWILYVGIFVDSLHFLNDFSNNVLVHDALVNADDRFKSDRHLSPGLRSPDVDRQVWTDRIVQGRSWME